MPREIPDRYFTKNSSSTLKNTKGGKQNRQLSTARWINLIPTKTSFHISFKIMKN